MCRKLSFATGFKLEFSDSLPSANCRWSAGLGAARRRRNAIPARPLQRACAPLFISNYLSEFSGVLMAGTADFYPSARGNDRAKSANPSVSRCSLVYNANKTAAASSPCSGAKKHAPQSQRCRKPRILPHKHSRNLRSDTSSTARGAGAACCD